MIETILNLNKNIVFAKDKNLKYLFISEAGAELADLDSPNQIIGKTDYDFIWKPQADLYRKGDSHVLKSGASLNVMEPRTQRNGIVNVMHMKTVMRDKKDNPIGVTGTAIELTGYSLSKNNGYIDPIKKIFYLGPKFCNAYLTRCEFEIFKYMLYGKRVEEISLKLCRSPKTIESHIKSIANKLQCTHKCEIVPTAIQNNLTHILNCNV